GLKGDGRRGCWLTVHEFILNSCSKVTPLSLDFVIQTRLPRNRGGIRCCVLRYCGTRIQRKYGDGGLQAAEPLCVAAGVLGYNGASQGVGVRPFTLRQVRDLLNRRRRATPLQQ